MVSMESTRQKLEECITFFKKDISALRTGRATPALVEHIMVEAYGAKTPIIHMATVTAPDPRTVIIQPWDKSLLKEIEKAITLSDLNIAPIVDSASVRLSMPQLTEENRKNLVKSLYQKAEASKVSIRREREKIRSDIARDEEEAGISEDQKFKAQKQLDELVKEYSDTIKSITEAKEAEIMTL